MESTEELKAGLSIFAGLSLLFRNPLNAKGWAKALKSGTPLLLRPGEGFERENALVSLPALLI